MSTSTTRLGLTKPATTESYDVAIVNTNNDKIDVAAGATPCTSTTRPSVPFAGQVIHESDTSEALVRNAANSAWLTVGTTAATASTIARRGSGGTLKVATATATDDAATKGQMDTAISTAIAATTGSWTTITLASPWTVYTGAVAPGVPGGGPYAPTFAYRQEGNRVFLRGWITNSSAVSAGAALHSTAVPSGLRPAHAVTLWPKAELTDLSVTTRRMEMFTDGKIYTVRAIASGSFAEFSEVSWYI